MRDSIEHRDQHRGGPDVLWITPVPPDRDGGGGHIRQANLLLALSEHARVHLVSSRPVTDPMVRAAICSLTELDIPDRPADRRTVRRLRDVWLATFARDPREVADLGSVRRALEAGPLPATAHVVVVEYAGLADMRLPPELSGSKRLLTMHNVGSVMAEHEAAIGIRLRHRWLARRQVAKWQAWTDRVARRYDALIAVSENDAASLAAPDRRIIVVPNGVDTERFRPTDLPAGPALVFTGALYTGPNRDGLRWFCSDILPLIRSRYPDVVVRIVGLRPPQDVAELAALPGVELYPDVADVRPFLTAARVVVVPIRIGSGTRLKVLEAMAAGRPVVSTSIGVEGLDVEAGRHVLIADQPDDFAHAVGRVIDDADLAGRLTGAGRELAESRYAWPVIQADFVAAVLDGVAP